ncbi:MULTISPECIES: hypothetical protein [unclassified Hydrogenophaga]|jgi:hypothetical protein|uniref:hypothetical protein n=1 Tax=unclassified Hydrogenophaga TaxID=2610897 RepID=UPI00131F61FE|nr:MULTISPECIES: hypothetical protein [unclassified Hydrogenophaga]MDP3351989.1 hypothetical protein [Hydrogenophaga sp.]QHE78623.1 hypothetical protein F9Z45_20975 [Hydrogenophaga sp. PBL-H3]QHE83048.1 hypothetical protein F9Z44_20975 [Hydrogenophaga sp. PBL-H3]
MSTTKNASIREPFAASVLVQAGVPAKDVVWFNRLTPAAKMQALVTERGNAVREAVRNFLGGSQPTLA